MGWLKIQTLDYLGKGTYGFCEIKKILTCGSYCFVAEVTLVCFNAVGMGDPLLSYIRKVLKFSREVFQPCLILT